MSAVLLQNGQVQGWFSVSTETALLVGQPRKGSSSPSRDNRIFSSLKDPDQI